MKILLDTCTFLWAISADRRLSGSAAEMIADRENAVFLSAVSGWEVAIKFRLGRLPLPTNPERFVQEWRRAHGLESLPLEEESALYEHRLPALHRDPFDRMLICQSIVHGCALLTPDPMIHQYPVRTLW